MSKGRKKSATGAMLDLWRPPQRAGDPIGCLTTTYTFSPGLFDEQCLARFLDIESEPDREDLAYLLERESRLGSVYAGVLVDHTQAGVEHSLRWDVLPVRIPGAKQHAKLSLLAWSRHVRLIITSANLSEPGYRTNYEVAGVIDLSPEEADQTSLADAVGFLGALLDFVPSAVDDPPEIRRARGFLARVLSRSTSWYSPSRGKTVRQRLTFTLPKGGKDGSERSGLEEAIQACRAKGVSPHEAKVASPFFDLEVSSSRAAAALCKLMARGRTRSVTFCVPDLSSSEDQSTPRLAAPIGLLKTPAQYGADVQIYKLPRVDEDRNHRPWHGKMLALGADGYQALMIGSSNFTCAGLGIGPHRNAEANLLTVTDRIAYGREVGHLESVWPKGEHVEDPESAEWLGAQEDDDEDEQSSVAILPGGFLSATYRAGGRRQVVLGLDPKRLPADWRILGCGSRPEEELLAATGWQKAGGEAVVEIDWLPPQPPERLVVRWDNLEAFLPLNVEDGSELPPPSQLEHMTADDMLLVLAASDPSAAFRTWAKRQQAEDPIGGGLDPIAPVDLDPLRRYDLEATFLHRIRRRARVLAQLRANLERPVWGLQALEWRLRGLIGVEALAEKLAQELDGSGEAIDEALLVLTDFLIVLREVTYTEDQESLSRREFEKNYRPFLAGLASGLAQRVQSHQERLPPDLIQFWTRVVEQCTA